MVRGAIANLPPVKRFTNSVLKDLGIPREALKYINQPTRYDNRETERALRGSKIKLAALDTYAWRLWDYWERHLDPDLFIDRSLEGKVKDKVVMITGGSSGIGLAAAMKLAATKAKILIVARGQEELNQAKAAIEKEGGQCWAYSADLTDEKSCNDLVATVVKEHGGVDILINNAGVGWFRPFVESSEEELVATVDVGLKGAILCARAVLPGMIARRRGQIVHVASDLARRPLAGMAAYAAAKHGLLGFSASLLREVKQHGVKVTAVLPGWTDTGFGGAREDSHADRETLTPEFVAGEIVRLLELPPDWVIDELAIHPLGQTF
jgi:short-subunit dehydrogenase